MGTKFAYVVTILFVAIPVHILTSPVRLAVCLEKIARRYVALHKRYHYFAIAAIFGIEVTAVFLTHEPLHHLSLSAGLTLWEVLVITAE